MKPKDAFDDFSIKVPFFVPSITNHDKTVVTNALSSSLLTDGPKLRQFEKDFAKFTGTRYAIGVSNGTSALHLALKSLGLKKNDEVIIPDLTFVATASAVLLAGARPVLADVDLDDMNISPTSIEENLTPQTKAILPVHLAGKACKINKITKIAKSHNLSILEDCAHAIGTICNGKHVGTFGKAGCFSFYPTKNFTTIEGGMVITNSKKIADFVRIARNHGLTKSLSQRFSRGKPWDYDVKQTGFNYRLDEIRASLGVNQLKRVKKLNKLRKNVCKYYYENLSDIDGIIAPNISNKNDNVYHLYIIRVNKNYGKSRDNLFRKLLKRGIRTSLHYKPLHEFTVYKKLAKKKSLSNTINLYNEILSLPLHPYLTRKEQDYVIKCIKHK